MRLILTCAALAACAACQQYTGSAAKADIGAETKAIEAVEQAQIAAINAHDPTGSTAPYADDALFVTERGVVSRGRASIISAFRGFVTDPTLKIDYRPGEKSFSQAGDLAYSTAEFSETFTDPATKKLVTIKGTNVSVWRKQADGSWKLVADSNPAAPTG